jgi:phosphotransferase family enzyme
MREGRPRRRPLHDEDQDRGHGRARCHEEGCEREPAAGYCHLLRGYGRALAVDRVDRRSTANRYMRRDRDGHAFELDRRSYDARVANGRRQRRELALVAVDEVARRLGLDAAEASVIAESNNTVVRLPAEALVAKASTSLLEGRGHAALEQELRLGRLLSDRGAPTAAPAPGPLAGPHRATGVTLTFWRYVAQDAKPKDADRVLGEAVRRFHAALAGVVSELPTLAERIDRAGRVLRDPAATPSLTVAERTISRGAHERLMSLVASLGTGTALHAEPHDGNILWRADGPVLVDFEAACRGPVEWDLAYLPPAALAAFPGRDDALIARLRPGVSFCVATWCLANPDPTPAVRQAAAIHWDAVRRSWLA